MATVPLPARKPPPVQSPSPRTAANGQKPVVSSGKLKRPFRIGIYGPPCVGKSTLVSLMEKIGKKPLYIDVDDGTKNLDVNRIESEHLPTFQMLRAVLHDPSYWRDYDTVVIDSLTRVEDLIIRFILDRSQVDSLEKADGGYGKGYRSLDEQMMAFLSDLELHIRANRGVVVIMHDCVTRTPNPEGSDFIRFEPRLYQSERVSLRARVREWLDHLFFINFDIATKDGKAIGSGSRTIYCQPEPHFLAKSRTLKDSVLFHEDDPELWKQLFNV